MNVVIVEDEKTAAENLKYLLSEIDASIYIDAIIDTVSVAVNYFSHQNNIELAFFDIHLADGISFEIFQKAQVSVPIIFTTAYDEYAIKAFKVNSIDYLLKPIDEDQLKEAIAKYKSKHTLVHKDFQQMLQLLSSKKKMYKSTYLVQQRDTLIPLSISDIAYFTINEGVVKAISIHNEKYIIDKKLEDIEADLNSDLFFRANRQYIVQRKAIDNLQLYFNGKLILNITPKSDEQIIVSKVKAPQIKKWLY